MRHNPADLMTRTLDAFVARMKLLEDFHLPERRYAHTGEVAYDCEQLVVAGTGIGVLEGQTQEGRSIRMPTVPVMGLMVSLVRDVPSLIEDTSEAPEPDDLTAAAVLTGSDADVLTETFWGVFSTGDVVESCDDVYFDGVTWDGPMGGVAATILQFRVQL